ncbi:hypothetical protein [Nocardia goodfellowii]|uniref:Uncharacterized protein n=1 Tax=Nocardia goodfellowii TaxID=882446 RepID=A0ABS4QL90_9NOCA|nr:hypothetical protein [Nocardia goodfellowii]MBP2191799.1 hypothetical protein [Nocardia goodfellowii]
MGTEPLVDTQPLPAVSSEESADFAELAVGWGPWAVGSAVREDMSMTQKWLRYRWQVFGGVLAGAVLIVVIGIAWITHAR